MIRGIGFLPLVAVVSLMAMGPRDARGDAFNPFQSGDAEADLPDPRSLPPTDPRHNPGIVVITDNAAFNGASNDVASSTSGLGWNFKDFRFLYDPDTDTLAVGMNFFGIAGDADGDGNPGSAPASVLSSGGVDRPNLGGTESIAAAFDTNLDGRYDLFAGIPADKSQVGNGLIGFTVNGPQTAEQRASTGLLGIERSFGAPDPDHPGVLAFNPSAEHPDFEFTISNFSKLPGLNPLEDFEFKFSAYAGSLDDVVSGEDFFVTTVPVTIPRTQVPVPEPTTLAAWAGVAGLIAVARWRRRARPTA